MRTMDGLNDGRCYFLYAMIDETAWRLEVKFWDNRWHGVDYREEHFVPQG